MLLRQVPIRVRKRCVLFKAALQQNMRDASQVSTHDCAHFLTVDRKPFEAGSYASGQQAQQHSSTQACMNNPEMHNGRCCVAGTA